MTTLDLSLPTRVVLGCGVLDRVGAFAMELDAKRIFVVTDPGIVAAGYADRVEEYLVASEREVRRFDDVSENPSESDVQACVDALGDWDADLIVAVGGGSAIDVAKGCSFVRAGGGRMSDYWGVGKAVGTLLPLIAIPTTAGTGTEVQSFALIEQDGTRQKMACGDPSAAPAIAVLDPELTVTQPRMVTACTGLDAIGHAVESAVTRKRTEASDRLATEAFVLLQASLPRVLEDPDDVEVRAAMLKGATLAGAAIEHSMLGAAHSMANPLTAQFGLQHGLAVGLMLPVVVQYNAQDPAAAGAYAGLARSAGLCAQSDPEGVCVAALVERLQDLLDRAGFARSLTAHGVTKGAAASLAEEAAGQWTAQFNPRPVTAADLRELYELACE